MAAKTKSAKNVENLTTASAKNGADEIKRLKARIKELEKEDVLNSQNHRQLRSHCVGLENTIRELQAEVSNLKCSQRHSMSDVEDWKATCERLSTSLKEEREQRHEIVGELRNHLRKLKEALGVLGSTSY